MRHDPIAHNGRYLIRPIATLLISLAIACTTTDLDGDGYIDIEHGGDDCDDRNAAVSPAAVERCGDQVDNDCDGLIDDTGDGASEWFPDGDDDGFGTSDASVQACTSPADHVDRGGDCDDDDPNRHPTANDTMGDDLDANCDDHDGVDNDGDGAASVSSGGDDCDDLSASFHPLATDSVGDDLDQNCDGEDGVDTDGDGAASIASGGADCDDTTSSIGPNVAEVPYDGLDQDCANGDLIDVDGDGSDATIVGGDDCDDDDLNTNPSAVDLVGDLVDLDCDGLDGDDEDADGVASEASGGADCDDLDPETYPNADEILLDSVDQDCDGADDASLAFLTDEIQVNTLELGSQHHPTVAFGAELDWLVAYSSAIDGDEDMRVRLFEDRGNPLLAETVVSPAEAHWPNVVFDLDRYLVAWTREDTQTLWLGELDLQGAMGEAIEVYVSPLDQPAYPVPLVTLTGDIALLFHDVQADTTAYLTASTDTSLTTATQATALSTTPIGGPLAGAIRPDGTLLAAWKNESGPDDATHHITLQGFDTAGAPTTDPVEVDQSETPLGRPELAIHSDGTIALVWRAQTENRDGLGAWLQLFDPNLVPLTAATPLSGSGFENRPAIAGTDNAFAIAWDDQHIDETDVFLRVHRWSDGEAISPALVVNTSTVGAQRRPHVDLAEHNGHLEGIITWEAFEFDAEARAVAARRFRVGRLQP